MSGRPCPLCKGIEGAKCSQDPESPLYGLFAEDFLVSAFFLGVTVERYARLKGMNMGELLCAPHLARVRDLGEEMMARGVVSPSNIHLLATGPHLRPVKG